jgi:hypothetical protein
MSFTGRDYDAAFSEACLNIEREPDADRVNAELRSLEWILWEAMRGALLLGSMLTAGALVAPLAFLIESRDSWQFGLTMLLAYAALVTAIYWLMRLAVWHEVSRHIRGREFGHF